MKLAQFSNAPHPIQFEIVMQINNTPDKQTNSVLPSECSSKFHRYNWTEIIRVERNKEEKHLK